MLQLNALRLNLHSNVNLAPDKLSGSITCGEITQEWRRSAHPSTELPFNSWLLISSPLGTSQPLTWKHIPKKRPQIVPVVRLTRKISSSVFHMWKSNRAKCPDSKFLGIFWNSCLKMALVTCYTYVITFSITPLMEILLQLHVHAK